MTMRFSSEDIAQQRFEVKMRGFDREQVREFLTVIAANLADYVAENRRLNTENEALAKEIAEFRRRERSLQDALEMAKRAADEATDRAERQAEVIIAEAELFAERKVVAAERAVTAARDGLSALKDQRKRVITEMRSTLEMYLHLIDSQVEPAYFSELDEEEPVDTDRGDTLPGGLS